MNGMNMFSKDDRVTHDKYGEGRITRTKVLGFSDCCSIEVTWDDVTKPKRLFNKLNMSELSKLETH